MALITRNTDGTIPEEWHDTDRTLMAYVWPGGYPMFYFTADGGILCPDCASAAEREGLTNDPDDAQWYIIGANVSWEDAALYCDHCSKRISSAYSEED